MTLPIAWRRALAPTIDMPTLAQQRLKTLNLWLWKSSRPRESPMGKMICRGNYASIVPQNLNAPVAGAFEPEALPIVVSASLAEGLSIIPIDMTAPLDQPRLADRIGHLLFLAGDGRELPPAVWIGITHAAQTPAQALADAGVGDGLADLLPTLFVPLYGLSPSDFRALRPLFPYVSTRGDPPVDEIPQFVGGGAPRPLNLGLKTVCSY